MAPAHHPAGEQHGELDITGSQREGEQPRDGEQDLESEIDVLSVSSRRSRPEKSIGMR